jgi:hypothetical protein
MVDQAAASQNDTDDPKLQQEPEGWGLSHECFGSLRSSLCSAYAE